VSVSKHLLADEMSVFRNVVIDLSTVCSIVIEVSTVCSIVDEVSTVCNVVVVHDEPVNAELEGNDVSVGLVPRFVERNFTFFSNRHLKKKK